MLDIPIIDVHVHAYATVEMHRKVLAALGSGTSRTDEGTPEGLLKLLGELTTSKASGAILKNMSPTAEMAKAAWDRVDRRLTHDEEPAMYAQVSETIAGRIRRRNAWGSEVTKKHPTIVNFIGVDPNFMTPDENVEELERSLKEGAKGISLHPCRNLHRPEDRRLYPLYERAQELDIPFVAHTGSEGFRPAYMGLYAAPSDYQYVIDDFPRLRWIFGHMGSGYFDEAIEMGHKYPNIYYDTAGVVTGGDSPRFNDEEMVQIIRRFGAENLMLGTDWALGQLTPHAQRIIDLPLTDNEKELILYRNAQEFLRI